MSAVGTHINKRILIIDDQETIHEDFRKALSHTVLSESGLDAAKTALFGQQVTGAEESPAGNFDLSFALQGEEGYAMAKRAIAEKRPYAVAFVDMRMPPGWDGIETINSLWQESPDTEVVICTAYSDYTWDEIVSKLGNSDKLLILKKPFDTVEVAQLANCLTEKWSVRKQAHYKIDEISRLVEERTRELHESHEELLRVHANLVDSHLEVRQANRAKVEFLANISHELRTPLTAICGHAELMCDACSQRTETSVKQIPQHLDVILRNGSHLLRLIDDLLDLSQIESGEFRMECEECSTFAIIDDIRTALVDRISARGLRFESGCDGEIPDMIRTDAARLKQILLNLLSNAVKFTESGGVRLIMRYRHEADGQRMQFDVIDTGIGMTEEKQDQIFEAFTQLDSSLTRRHGGPGMGLAISKRLATLLGGSLTVSSRAGEGSTFRLDIPVGPLDRVRLVSSPDDARTKAPAQPEPIQQVLAHYNLLLAEDGEDNRRLITHILKKAGAQVAVVENGRLAMDEALAAEKRDSPFDAIIMDMQMPVLDGYTATRQLRELGYDRPIIALTAHAMSTDRDKCIQAGCSDYASKPINRKLLLDTIAQWASNTMTRV